MTVGVVTCVISAQHNQDVNMVVVPNHTSVTVSRTGVVNYVMKVGRSLISGSLLILMMSLLLITVYRFLTYDYLIIDYWLLIIDC